MLLCLLKKSPKANQQKPSGKQLKTNQKKYKSLSIEIFMLARRGFAEASQPEYLFKPEGSEDDTSHQRQDAKRHQAFLCLREFCWHLLDHFVGHRDRVNLCHIRRVMHLFLPILRVPLLDEHRVALFLYRDAIVEPH